MALHPQCKAFLDQLASMGGRPMHQMTPAEARGLALPPELAGPERPMHSVVDRTVPGPGGQVPVRVYTPAPGRRLPGLIYFRGGGFVLGTLNSSDRVCRDLAHLAGRVVVSVDYRLAPEHPFPAPVDDAYAATNFPFEIVTLYPEFFSASVDDTERAAVLLHEAEHLLGAGEERALETAWRSKTQLGWAGPTYSQSKVWNNTKELTQRMVPNLFTCGADGKSDCTE